MIVLSRLDANLYFSSPMFMYSDLCKIQNVETLINASKSETYEYNDGNIRQWIVPFCETYRQSIHLDSVICYLLSELHLVFPFFDCPKIQISEQLLGIPSFSEELNRLRSALTKFLNWVFVLYEDRNVFSTTLQRTAICFLKDRSKYEVPTLTVHRTEYLILLKNILLNSLTGLTDEPLLNILNAEADNPNFHSILLIGDRNRYLFFGRINAVPELKTSGHRRARHRDYACARLFRISKNYLEIADDVGPFVSYQYNGEWSPYLTPSRFSRQKLPKLCTINISIKYRINIDNRLHTRSISVYPVKGCTIISSPIMLNSKDNHAETTMIVTDQSIQFIVNDLATIYPSGVFKNSVDRD